MTLVCFASLTNSITITEDASFPFWGRLAFFAGGGNEFRSPNQRRGKKWRPTGAASSTSSYVACTMHGALVFTDPTHRHSTPFAHADYMIAVCVIVSKFPNSTTVNDHYIVVNGVGVGGL